MVQAVEELVKFQSKFENCMKEKKKKKKELASSNSILQKDDFIQEMVLNRISRSV